MEHIVWLKEYSVGNKKLDAQHHKIISLINSLDDYLGDGEAQQPISEVLDELQAYIVEHFSTEEALLQKKKYPGLDEQKKSHDRFIKQFSHLCAEMDGGVAKQAKNLIDFLVDWWRTHILEEDMRYKKYV